MECIDVIINSVRPRTHVLGTWQRYSSSSASIDSSSSSLASLFELEGVALLRFVVALFFAAALVPGEGFADIDEVALAALEASFALAAAAKGCAAETTVAHNSLWRSCSNLPRTERLSKWIESQQRQQLWPASLNI